MRVGYAKPPFAIQSNIPTKQTSAVCCGTVAIDIQSVQATTIMQSNTAGNHYSDRHAEDGRVLLRGHTDHLLVVITGNENVL